MAKTGLTIRPPATREDTSSLCDEEAVILTTNNVDDSQVFESFRFQAMDKLAPRIFFILNNMSSTLAVSIIAERENSSTVSQDNCVCSTSCRLFRNQHFELRNFRQY